MANYGERNRLIFKSADYAKSLGKTKLATENELRECIEYITQQQGVEARVLRLYWHEITEHSRVLLTKLVWHKLPNPQPITLPELWDLLLSKYDAVDGGHYGGYILHAAFRDRPCRNRAMQAIDLFECFAYDRPGRYLALYIKVKKKEAAP